MKNCLTYALGMWWKYGGYVKVRKSLIAKLHGVGPWHWLNLVPHFLHQTRDGQVTQLVRSPEEIARAKELGPWLDWLWLWHFQGQILNDDKGFTDGD